MNSTHACAARKLLLTLCLGWYVSAFATASFAAQPEYKDKSKPIDSRVKDLLKRMTLEEKLAQLQTLWGQRQALETEAGVFNPTQAQALMGDGIGQIARPSENKAPLSPNKTPEQTVAFINASQRWLMENTRLGIPAIFHEEALHGHSGRNATSFPQAIASASTWDPQLLKEIYTVAAREIRHLGATQALTPILDVARDPRWGRIEETMGEDPYLIAAMGVAAVQGFQGDAPGRIGNDRVIATLKHLAGHGEPAGGLNIAPIAVGERTLREIFLFPFEAAIKLGGARSVMASYNEIDGVPSHANSKLLNDILRQEWGFNGVVVSDYSAIAELASRHHLTDSKAEAGRLAITAGVDVEMPDGDAYKLLGRLVEQGKLKEQVIDQAVARVLHEKFLLGLFEHPFADADAAADFIGNGQHRALAQQAAEKAMVLLKNDDQLLPLDKSKLQSIALIGPHVHEVLLGGYSDVPKQTVSILQGLQEYLGEAVHINYAQGTLLTSENWQPGADSLAANTLAKERWHTDAVVLATAKDTRGMIEQAVNAARKSDVAIVVVGDNEATSREAWVESHLGDRSSLDLLGEQQALVDAVLATGTPTVVLLINGRPLAISKIAEQAPAIIEGWYLGQETGHAVARVLFGEANPGGKLPLSFPRSVGHIPAYYNHKPTAKRGYAFSETSPLFPFGHGLSYSEFIYSDLQINKASARAGDEIQISMKLSNSGKRDGDEVVQLYIRDPIASLTRPVKELKGFQRVSLKAKESAEIKFTLSVNQLGFYDQKMNYIVEPGKIELMLGSSSADIRLAGEFTIAGKTEDVGKNKVYLTRAQVVRYR